VATGAGTVTKVRLPDNHFRLLANGAFNNHNEVSGIGAEVSLDAVGCNFGGVHFGFLSVWL